MSNKVLPTLTVFGFTSNPRVKLERLFIYFLTSEYSQSLTFLGKILSFKYILNRFSTEPHRLREEMVSTLYTLYNKYFDNVEVEVNVVEIDGGRYKLNIFISAEDNGENVILDEILYTEGVNIINLVDILMKGVRV